MKKLPKNTSRLQPWALLSALAIALLLSPSLVQAQTTSPNPEPGQPATAVSVESTEKKDSSVLQLSPFEVKSSSEEDGYLTKRTASTSRVAVDFLELAQSVSTIPKQFISDYNLRNIRQIYEAMPNIYTGSTDQSSRLWIRGSEINGLYVDGVRSQAMFEYPLQFLDRVELVRGPSPSTFSVGQPGGSLNVATKTPTGRTGGIVEVGIGDYKNYLANVDYEGVLNPGRFGKTAYRVVGFYDIGNDFIKEQNHKGAGGLLSLRTEINPTTRVISSLQFSSTNAPVTDNATLIWTNKVGYNWMQTTYGNGTNFAPLPNSTPWTADRTINGVVGWAGGDLLPAGLTAFPSNFRPYGVNDLFRGAAAIEKSFFDNALNVRLGGNFERNTGIAQYVTVGATAYVNPATGQPYAAGSSFEKKLTEYANRPVGFNNNTAATRRALSLDVNYRREILAGNWTFAIGAAEDSADSWSRSLNFTGFKNPDGTDVWITFIPNSRDRSVNHAQGRTISGQSRSYSYRTGAYAAVKASYFNDRFQLQYSDRQDKSASRTLNELTRVQTKSPEVKAGGAPYYSVLVKPLKWLSVYALYAKHADPVAQALKYTQSRLVNDPAKQAEFDAIYNNYTTVLSATPTGSLKEFGVKTELLDGNLALSADIFEMTTSGAFVTNVINYFEASSPYFGGQVVERRPGGSSAKGVEVELTGRIGKDLILSASYGITRGTRDTNPFVIDPPSTFRLHGKYSLPPMNGWRVYLLGGVTRWGPFLTVQDNVTIFIPSAQYRYDAGIGCTWKQHSVELTQNNLERDLKSISPQTAYALSSSPQLFFKYKYKF